MDNIYREELMEIYKNPKHRGNLDSPSAKTFAENPICGDEIQLQLKIEKGIIKKARFEGAACAVSIISSEKLLSFIEGKTIQEAKNLTQKDLLKILDINVSMSRLRCATLVLTALKEALRKENQK
jgi:nitrogen fixation NifU-like protein